MARQSAANLHTAIRAAMLELFHKSLDELTPAERAVLGWAAETADRLGEDVRSAVEEAYRSLVVSSIKRKDAAHDRSYPHRDPGGPSQPERPGADT